MSSGLLLSVMAHDMYLLVISFGLVAGGSIILLYMYMPFVKENTDSSSIHVD